MNLSLKCFVLFLSASFLHDVKGSCPYTYHNEGWFHYQEIPMTWQDAALYCQLDEATLASPTTQQIKNIMMKSIVKGDIFTGIHSVFPKGEFYSFDGIPLYKIPHTWAKSEPDNKNNTEKCIALNSGGYLLDVACDKPRPFMCFKKKQGNFCGASDYEYNNLTKKCYKVHSVSRLFYKAQFVCSSEGGHLAIINSAQESKVVGDIFTHFPANKITGSYLNYYALVGFHRLEHNENWKTLQGQTLNEAGFGTFAPGEPNNRDGPEDCGSITYNGLFNDVQCHKNYPFICEKEPYCPSPCSICKTSQSLLKLT